MLSGIFCQSPTLPAFSVHIPVIIFLLYSHLFHSLWVINALQQASDGKKMPSWLLFLLYLKTGNLRLSRTITVHSLSVTWMDVWLTVHCDYKSELYRHSVK